MVRETFTSCPFAVTAVIGLLVLLRTGPNQFSEAVLGFQFFYLCYLYVELATSQPRYKSSKKGEYMFLGIRLHYRAKYFALNSLACAALINASIGAVFLIYAALLLLESERAKFGKRLYLGSVL